MPKASKPIQIASPAALETVRAAALTGLFEVSAQLSLNIAPLLRDAGITRAMLKDPELPLPARSAIALLERCASACSCPTFGLRMVQQRKPGDVGLLSVLIAHQPTLRDVLARAHEFRHRLNPVLSFEQNRLGELTAISPTFLLNPLPPCRQSVDVALAVLHQTLASIFGEAWSPVRACFSYARPLDNGARIHEAVFETQLQFDAEFDGFLIRTSDLDLRNPNSDRMMALHVRRLIDMMTSPRPRSLVQEVEATTLTLMRSQRATIGAVADALGLKQRTLQRRLDAENEQFSAILNRLRADEVEDLLQDLRLSLSAIANRLGFAAESTFSRWHRAAFGDSPSRRRERMREVESNDQLRSSRSQAVDLASARRPASVSRSN